MASLATNKANSAGTDALKAEGFSVGEQNGTPVTSDSDYYENNAKYYADEAQGYAESIDPDTLAKLEDISELLPTETASGAIASFNDYICAQVLADEIKIAPNDGAEVEFDEFNLNIQITKS